MLYVTYFFCASTHIFFGNAVMYPLHVTIIFSAYTSTTRHSVLYVTHIPDVHTS